jgi:colanic acid/amylovoran biosynthesis glycosyltransferase
MRIAFVTGGLKMGGSTTFLLNLAGELESRGIPNVVLSFEEEHPLASDFEAREVEVIRQRETRDVFEDRMSAVLSELNRFSPTHIIACLGPESFEVLRYVPSGVRRLGMVQSDDPRVYRTLSAYTAFMDATVGVSQKAVQTLRNESSLRSLPAHYLPYGISIPPEPSPQARNTHDPLRIIYLGRLHQEQKRARLFPGIQKQLIAAGVPFSWTIAGDGPERSFLEVEMRRANHHAAIRFAGTVPYHDVPRLLQQHDVFLLPSVYEGLPLSLLEAMASGVVPVVSDLASGIRDVVDETTGILVQPDDVDGYGRGIADLHHNRDLLNQKARDARRRVVAEFSAAAMADRWLATLALYPHREVTWPTSCRIFAMVTAPHAFRFTTVGRVLRKLTKQIRHLFSLRESSTRSSRWD